LTAGGSFIPPCFTTGDGWREYGAATRYIRVIINNPELILGHVLLCRYNGNTGRFDFHVLSTYMLDLQQMIEAEARVEIAGYSLSPFVDVTTFFPRVHPSPQASFSFPKEFDTISPTTERLDTSLSHLFLSRLLAEPTQVLKGISEEPLPLHCKPVTSPPHMPRLEWSLVERTTGFSRDAFICIDSVYSNSLRFRQYNPPIVMNLREQNGTTYSKLSPSWMGPGNLLVRSLSR